MLHRLLSVSVSCLKDKASITDGIHASILFEEGSGIRVISAKHPKDNYFELSLCEEISAIQHTQNPRTALRVGDVILSTVGTIGNVAVVDPSMLPANSDRHVGIIRPNGGMPPEFISTFLLSRYGRFQTRRETTGNVQPNLFISKISELIIPIFSNDFMHSIQTIVCSASECRRRSELRTLDAQQILLHALGLGGWQPSEPLTYTRRASEAFAAGRLDAEYFSPRVRNLISYLSKDGLKIGNVARPQKKHFDSHINGDFNYIEISDVHNDGTASSERLHSAEAPSRATWHVHKGDVITSMVRPIRRLSAQITQDQDGFVCSSGFVVLKPISVSSELLLTYLRLPLICELLDLHTSASMYPAISEQDMLRIPFRRIESPYEDKIIQCIQNAYRARNDARLLLVRAKRAVEIAIEQSEAAALEYLNKVSD